MTRRQRDASVLLVTLVLCLRIRQGAAYIEGDTGECRSELLEELAAQESIVPGESGPPDLGWGTRSTADWGKNFNYSAKLVYFPKSVSRLQDIVRKSCGVRVLGSRQSINRIADTPDTLVSLEHLKVASMEDGLRVQGGAMYSDIIPVMMEYDALLPNIPTHPYINVVGAIATGSHGSGRSLGVLGTSVTAVTVVTPSGALDTVRKGDPDFPGAVVSLGALGPVVEVTLAAQRAFAVGQCVYGSLPIHELLSSWDEMTAGAYSLSLYTNWDGGYFSSVWLRHKIPAITEGSGRRRTHCPDSSFYGAPILTHIGVHPIFEYEPRGVTRTSKRGDLSNLATYSYAPGRELGGRWSEYFVPLDLGAPAILDLFNSLVEDLHRVAMVSEVRVVAADDLWLSPCYRRDCAAISFQWNNTVPDAVDAVLPRVEEVLARYEAAPHWGGLFAMPPEVLQGLPVYREVLPRVREMLRRRDPGGKFRNEFVDRYVFREAGAAALGGADAAHQEL